MEKNVVASAAALLDILHPGWADWIDLSKHTQNEGEKCVAGQIAAHLGLENDVRRNALRAGSGEESSWYFERLDAAWSNITGESPHEGYPFASGYDEEWKDEIRARQSRRPFVSGLEDGSAQDASGSVLMYLSNEANFEDAGEGFVRIVDPSGDEAVLDVRALAEIVGLRVASTLPLG